LTGSSKCSRDSVPCPNVFSRALSISGHTVLGSGPAAAKRTTGAGYSKAVEKMIAEAKASFDLVLIESPALL
jgi:hypothetical protein